MVQMIIGNKGKGKTKQLLDRANTSIKTANGNIVYIDKSSKHMLELNNKIRLIDASSFGLRNSDEFIGFILGIISQDHDLEQMYFDSFLKVSHLEGKDITATIQDGEESELRMTTYTEKLPVAAFLCTWTQRNAPPALFSVHFYAWCWADMPPTRP